MATIAFHTLGCKVSQYETEAVREELLRQGFAEVPFPAPADAYVINTCTVTAESDRKSRQMIRRAHAASPTALIFVMGCYSQRDPARIAALPGVAYITGSGGKMKIAEVLGEYLARREEGCLSPTPTVAVTNVLTEPFEKMCVRGTPRTRAYIKIEDGCDCRCTYCAISPARGHVRSKAPDDVVAEVGILVGGGTREVVLTGIETASYGKDREDGLLIDLLERIEQESTIDRIRLGSLTPEVLTEDFVTRIARLTKPVPHFHISLQSGSSRVLAGMRRRYNAAQAMDGIRRLRSAIPTVELTADVMVGFPGETAEDFEETVRFCEEASFLSMHVFAFSPRGGTPAAIADGQVAEEEKQRRSRRLILTARGLTEERMKRAVEERRLLSVLFETEDGAGYVGHSCEFFPVYAESTCDLRGKIHTVIPTAVRAGILVGNLIK